MSNVSVQGSVVPPPAVGNSTSSLAKGPTDSSGSLQLRRSTSLPHVVPPSSELLPQIHILQLFRVVNSAIMTPLRCCSFNCRGWNSGLVTLKSFINSLDICLIQKHWLLNDHLHKIHEISTDFLSVA